MKRIISLLLSIIIVMSLANVSFAAVGDVTVDENGEAWELFYEDSFTGTAGEAPANWVGYYAPANNETLKYVYAADPVVNDNSVLMLHRASGNTRKKLRYYVGYEDTKKYTGCISKDMQISFRLYHTTSDTSTEIYLRDWNSGSYPEGSKVGHVYFDGSSTGFDVTPNTWYDVFFDIDIDGSSICTNAYMTDGTTKTVLLENHTATLAGDYLGINAIDFESRAHASFNGTAYIDDFKIYTAPDEKSVVFASDYLYKTTTVINTLPVTYEATVKVPTEVEDSGVIIGTYEGKGTSGYFTFDIIGGVPKIYIAANSTAYTFDEVDVRGDEAVQLAITFDAENQAAYCYVNGELKQTLTNCEYPAGTALYRRAFLGGDASIRDFSRYFKGEITGLKLYSDLRTAEEISTDFAGSTPDADNLIAAYAVSAESDGSAPKVIKDLSGNGHDFYYNEIFIDEVPVEDYAYSFAVVGDTQYISRDYPQSFKGIYDWILDNSEEYNTKFVFGLGDITDTDANREYALAQVVIDSLKEALPFSIIRGNHDSQAQYNKFFQYSEYEDEVSGSYDGTMLNTYRKFEVGNIKYLHIGLDYNPSTEALAWADGIVTANPDRNVIVTTHSYLGMSGVRNSHGSSIWDNFVKKHKNIVLVMSGHVICDSVVLTKSEGVGGNTVTQLLINPQGADNREQRSGLGIVAMLHFSEDGKNVQLRYYSTVKKKYFLTENQFSFNLDVIESEGEEDIKPEIIASNISFDVDLGGKTTGKLIAALYDGNQRLCESKIYDAAQKVNVSFSKAADNSNVKLMWWDGTTITPMTNY